MLKLSRDINGNKTLVFSPGKGQRGFSVQTNGNLKETHRLAINGRFCDYIAADELNAFIKEYGTTRQKELLGWY
tara:strand:- start:45 stop:266 length:222 start_codon:yes stop_codon:yes gene_type:complete